MITLDQLSEHIQGVVHGNKDLVVSGVSSLMAATSQDVAFFHHVDFPEQLQKTQAGVVLMQQPYLQDCPTHAIVVPHPIQAMSKAAELLYQTQSTTSSIHPTAVIDPQAEMGQGVTVGAHAVIQAGVKIGQGSFIGAHVYLHHDVVMGNNVQIESGAVLGSFPFNYSKDKGSWTTGPVLGTVRVGHGARIGANTTIDRGALGDTLIGDGVIIDNLVQIAHDVVIARQTAIAACAVVGSYVQIGRDCIIGGGSCIAPNVRIHDNAVITGMTTVSKSIRKPGIYSSGTLASDHQGWRKNATRFKRLDHYIKRLNKLERHLLRDHHD